LAVVPGPAVELSNWSADDTGISSRPLITCLPAARAVTIPERPGSKLFPINGPDDVGKNHDS
jgi:hypothetical protein